jgi:uncharacterized protein YutE (UPF0331/DUF86 family)
MDTEQGLNRLAERYRTQGYDVVVRPGTDALPPFAKDFQVEILARRADGNVLASVKGSHSELEADPNLSRYAEVIEKHPGWRYDIYVLGPAPRVTPENRDAKEPSELEVSRSLDDAERMLQAGFIAQAVIAAWAALESAMRHRLRSQGSEAGWGTSPRTMLNELVSSGAISQSAFRDLESLFRLRNVIVHGYSAPAVEPAAVRFLIDTARRLWADSHPAKQTA